MSFSKGKVYAIRCNKTGLQYIGSTTLDLDVRLKRHVEVYAMYLRGTNSYCHVNKVLEGGDYSIVLLEAYPCTTRKELRMREGYYQRNMPCINTRRETTFQITNPCWYKQRVTCDCGKEYNYSNKHHHELTQRHKDWLDSVLQQGVVKG